MPKTSKTRKRGRQAEGKNWFEQEFGIMEPRAKNVHKKFTYDSTTTILKRNGEKHGGKVGEFTTPSVADLHKILGESEDEATTRLSFQHVVGEVREVCLNPDHANTVMHGASHTNCLEMVDPSVTSEQGVTIYANDHTQGPKLAMACPRALFFRNYFLEGQCDTTEEVARLLENDVHKYWEIKNGYLLPTSPDKMTDLANRFLQEPTLTAEAVLASRVGVQWNADTARDGDGKSHGICQVFCAAAPVSYATEINKKDWEPLAQVFLDAAYESTLAVAAILARDREARVTVYLTLVGGGAFGNDPAWIIKALQRALVMYKSAPIDVKLVHYKTIPPEWPEAVPAV
jgi:hypothetical protein